ncbi:MAG: hypothetical protein EXR65_03275 [Dehalococcoidia bacterium]|nr:hypothetical protein [Dehalococcoidia bacterium]
MPRSAQLPLLPSEQPRSGKELERACARTGRALGLDVRTQVRVGRRIWGPQRYIDVVLSERSLRRSLGVECKYQATAGTAEEKIPATIDDIAAWPIAGIVCFTGPGFSQHMRSFLLASGKAVELADLEDWLRLYFALDFALDAGASATA